VSNVRKISVRKRRNEERKKERHKGRKKGKNARN
jgi:hypothetical protein